MKVLPTKSTMDLASSHIRIRILWQIHSTSKISTTQLRENTEIPTKLQEEEASFYDFGGHSSTKTTPTKMVRQLFLNSRICWIGEAIRWQCSTTKVSLVSSFSILQAGDLCAIGSMLVCTQKNRTFCCLMLEVEPLRSKCCVDRRKTSL